MMKRLTASLCLVVVLSCTGALCRATASWMPEKTSGTSVFYVAPDGNDNAAGTRRHPWCSVEGVVANVAEYMAEHPGVEVTVRFSGGEYFLPTAASFNNLASALKLEASGKGEPVISGSRPVSGWTKVTDDVLLSRMPVSSEGKIWQADLRACGISGFGDVISRKNRPDFYYCGKRQILARWPDSGFATAGKAVGATDLEETWIHVHGTVEGCLEYEDDRIAKWTAEPDACVFGYWYWDWADGYSRLMSVDPEKRVFSLAKPWSGYGYRDGMRFYGLNLLCELDAPGEYYIDKTNGFIYWYAPDGFDPDDSHTELSVSKDPYLITVNDCVGFSIDGFTLKGGRNGALKVSGGDGVSVCNCRFTCFGENAIWFNGGVNHRVSGCKLDELGASGIRLTGGNRKKLEPCNFCVDNTIVDNFSLFKRTYEPAVLVEGVGMMISNCLFSHSSSSALRLDGNDILVQYCQFFDLVTESDDQGATDSWFDYTFRGMTFKHNYFKDIRGGMYAGACAIRFDDIISGNMVYGNVFERCGGAHFGAVNINGGRDNHVCNNIFYECPTALTGCSCQGEEWKEKMKLNQSIIDAVDGLGPIYVARYPEIKSSYESEYGYNYLDDNIVVNTPYLCSYPDLTKTRNNTMLTDDALGLSHYLKPSVQQAAGLTPIPFQQIGVKSNRFKEK